jgi:hypothetical protein
MKLKKIQSFISVGSLSDCESKRPKELALPWPYGVNQPQCQLPELRPPATANHKHSHETQYWAQKADHVQRPDHILLDDYAQTCIRQYYVDMKVLLICSTHMQTLQNFFSFLVNVESFGLSWKFCNVLWFLLDALWLFILLPIPRYIPWNSSTKQILNNVYS